MDNSDSKPKERGKKTNIIIVAIVTGLVAISAYPLIGKKVLSAKSDSGLSRLDRILSPSDSTGVSGRVELWGYWLPKALDAPLYGRGLYFFQGGTFSPDSRIVDNQGTHNTWIMLLGEIGVLGPLIYSVLFILAFFRIFLIEKKIERFLLFLLLGVYFSYTLKAHTLLAYPYYNITMSFLLYLPWFFDYIYGHKNDDFADAAT